MHPLFRPRSFERRNSRLTASQKRAIAEYWPQYGLEFSKGLINFELVFGRQALCFLEIGFGSGQSLLALAAENRDKNFIGMETHKPGIGALLIGMQSQGLTNIRLYEADAVDVLEHCIPIHSLDNIQIFFPDPWPKRRHHARRLIQDDFVNKLVNVLKPQGTIHLATDWQDYATHMMRVLTQQKNLTNLAGEGCFSKRSPYRPMITKFEAKGLREGREVFDLQFAKLVRAR